MAYVAARKLEEELIVGQARIKVIEIRGGVVRLAITAPESVVIRRGEQTLKLKDLITEKASNVGTCVLDVA